MEHPPFLIGRFVIMIPLNKKIVLYILHFLYNQACTQGGSTEPPILYSQINFVSKH